MRLSNPSPARIFRRKDGPLWITLERDNKKPPFSPPLLFPLQEKGHWSAGYNPTGEAGAGSLTPEIFRGTSDWYDFETGQAKRLDMGGITDIWPGGSIPNRAGTMVAIPANQLARTDLGLRTQAQNVQTVACQPGPFGFAVLVDLLSPGIAYKRVLDWNDGTVDNRISILQGDAMFGNPNVSMDVNVGGTYQGFAPVIRTPNPGLYAIYGVIGPAYSRLGVVGEPDPDAKTDLVMPTITRMAFGGVGYNTSENSAQWLKKFLRIDGTANAALFNTVKAKAEALLAAHV